MRNPFAFLKFAILLLAALSLGACGDTGGEEEPPPNGEEPKETFPCEGPWCFDPENNPRAKEAWDRYSELMHPDTFKMFSESYAACSYTQDDQDVVVVRCPDWVMPEMATCPQNWFELLGRVGEIYIDDADETTVYCFPDTDRVKAIQSSFLCAEGYVNPGHAASDFDERLAGNAWGASCLRPEDCATLEDLRWPSQEKSCFYSDFSHISEGPPEEVDCDTLAEGECASNCACPELPHNLESVFFSSCNYISPRQSVGICGYSQCQQDDICSVPELVEGRCLHQLALPDWAQRYKDGLEETAGYEMNWGLCVQEEHFANWRNNDDPAYRYGDE